MFVELILLTVLVELSAVVTIHSCKQQEEVTKENLIELS